MLIGFVIPFKPKCQSSDWAHDCRLLNRTIHSLLNQTNKDFAVYVVYTDLPINIVKNSHIKYIPYFEPFRPYEEIKQAEKYIANFSNRKEYMARYFDKGKKVTYGCKFVKKDRCLYAMNVDADDLISNKLVDFVSLNNRGGKADGWFIPKGFVWRDGSNILLRQRQMQDFNGSTHIIRSDIVPIPNFTSTDWTDYNLFAAHGWTVNRLKNIYGKIMEPIPFECVIYVVHQSNNSNIGNKIGILSLKKILKMITRGQILSRNIKKEFFNS